MSKALTGRTRCLRETERARFWVSTMIIRMCQELYAKLIRGQYENRHRYEHSSNLVLNDQFEAAYSRPNIVTVKCEIPISEMTSGYKAEHAKDSVGYLDWHSGVVAGKLKSNKRKVYLSRYLKVVEIMDNAEVAKMYKETLGDQDIAVPFNVVTPGLRTELEKVGVKIDENGTPGYQSLQKRKENNNDAKYSIREIVSESGKDYGKGVYLDSTFLDNLSDSERIDLIKEYVRELAHKELSAFDRNGNEYLITVLGSERFLSKSGKRIPANTDLRRKNINIKTKQEAIALIDEVVVSSKIVKDGEKSKYAHGWIDNFGKSNWKSLQTYVIDRSGEIWSVFLSVSKGADGNNYLYDLNTKKEGERVSKFTAEPLLDKKISQNESDVNSKYSDRDSASYTEDRIDRIIAEYGASSPNYAQAYVATISPRDFLKLTINDEVLSKWNDAEGKNEEIYPLDKDKLSGNTQSPFLAIEDGEVIGHEGRHRMRAMMNAGITRVPVIIRETSTKYSKKKMSEMTLTSQDFGRGNVNSGYRATITNLIPTNKVYRDDIISSYGRDSELKFSDRDSEGNALTKAQQEYFKDSKVRDGRGNLIPVYHGTEAQFTIFDRTKRKNGKSYGNGIYFTDSEKSAKTFGGNVMKSYLNITNPLEVEIGSEETYAKVREYLGLRKNAKVTFSRLLSNINGQVWNDKFMLRDHTNDTPAYDGVIIRNSWDMNGDRFTEYEVWDSNQAKLTTNESPTNNPDIRFSERETEDYIKKSTQKYGDVESAAVEHFGLTNDFRIAGYILRDGRIRPLLRSRKPTETTARLSAYTKAEYIILIHVRLLRY